MYEALAATPVDVVARAEAYWRAHRAERVPVSRLCLVVGRSERGLRSAFYAVRGMSPMRCMLAERLREVQRALRHPAAESITVTAVATKYGFFELGRFAAIYREAFGEAPSDTLRSTGRKAGLIE
jgi:transcriptional regulator GlxA family with amidase domain